MTRAVQPPAARRDFIIHYVYLAENAGLDVAKRFRQAVESAYAQLAEMPGMGALAKVRHMREFAFGASADLRKSHSLQTSTGRRRYRTAHPRQTGLSAHFQIDLDR